MLHIVVLIDLDCICWLKKGVGCAEGRVEKSTGNLMCSYHGWQFQGEGKCTSIPQAIDPKAAATAIASPRACATPYPTQVGRSKSRWVSIIVFHCLLSVW
jgi:nitrite reductase/ring-hydroxylating ferredoxin subunit